MADLGEIVGLVERALGPAESEPVRLAGGITNRNFRIRFGGRDCVLRVTGKDTELLGIDRVSERAAADQAAALNIGPAVLGAGPGYLVTEYVDCAAATPAVLRAAPEAVAEALRAFHDSSLRLANRFWVPELLDKYARIIRDRGQSPPAQYALAQSLAKRIAAVLPLRDAVPCHDDLLAANVLVPSDSADQVMLVDWEYAGMGHRLFDLGNLAVNNEFDAADEDRLLSAYYGDESGLGRRSALALMRIMSDAREAAWGVVQSTISDLRFDFTSYGGRHFARLEQATSDSRFETWLADAAGS
ncbi:MAG: phosphotransferase [Solirubrobacteraceae bacterium]